MKTLHLSSARPADVRRAVALLKKGGRVAFATETVYGLGADALNPRAVLGIFRAKHRPSFDPLIVHLADARQLSLVAAEIPPLARRLAARFWPGGLTIIFPKKKNVPDLVTAGLSTVAVRIPAHPAARALLEAFGGPVAAPSANRFGRTSPTLAAHVLDDLDGRIEAVLDGGAAAIGVESTIVRIQNNSMIVLRPGAVPVEALAKFGPVRIAAHRPGEVLAPGGMPTHYAPRTPMALLPEAWTAELTRLERGADGKKPNIGLLLFKPTPVHAAGVRVVWNLSRHGSVEEAAANLFRAIRNLDKMSLDVILAGPVPRKGLGRAITDRLEKAASGRRAGSQFYRNFFQSKKANR